MTTMFEKATRAVVAHDMTWSDISDEQWAEFKAHRVGFMIVSHAAEHVRVVLKAIREPDEAAMKAGVAATTPYFSHIGGHEAFTGIIDHILVEPQSTTTIQPLAAKQAINEGDLIVVNVAQPRTFWDKLFRRPVKKGPQVRRVTSVSPPVDHTVDRYYPDFD
jgi:hypothetical protein